MFGFRWPAVLCVLGIMVAGCGGPGYYSGAGDEETIFGFIPRVEATARTIAFDQAEWLTGEEATRAAVAAGAIEPGEAVPNDYFIRNQDAGVVVLRVSEDVRIRGATPVTKLKDGPPCDSCSAYPLSVDAFFAAYDDGDKAAQGKYWVTISDGEVVSIEEQYTP
jgi:hypothetical protein